MTQRTILIAVLGRWISTIVLLYFFSKEQTGLATRILLFSMVFDLEGSKLTKNIEQWVKIMLIKRKGESR